MQSSISIRCENQDVKEDILDKLQEFFEDFAQEQDYKVDMNYDVTKHGYHIIKVEHASTENEAGVF